ncbi:MAG: cysteine desulfurase [Planctomycetes bacterium]|nr:cysteine desulfurase [Planctomycetota bacterium]
MLYFDNNATTAADPEVVAAMLPFLGERFGNPSSAHALGEDAADAVRAARASVARLLGATAPDEIVFTSGGTESNNLALRAAFAAQSGRRVIVTCATEHSSVLEPCAQLERSGARVVRAGVSRTGLVDLPALMSQLTPECAVVSLMLANNEIGVVQDIAPLGARCRELGILFHADLVQAAGKLPLSVRALNADLATISAHKLHGPKGVGALYVRAGLACAPLVFGGSQERGRRPGTENVAGIVGFGRAAELARAFAADVDARARVASLRDEFENGLLARIPGASVNGARDRRVANTTSIRFAGLDAETLLMSFSSQGLYASAGSACHAQARRPSHVLLALGLAETEAAECVRFSLSRHTTSADCRAALEIVAAAAAELRVPGGL